MLPDLELDSAWCNAGGAYGNQMEPDVPEMAISRYCHRRPHPVRIGDVGARDLGIAILDCPSGDNSWAQIRRELVRSFRSPVSARVKFNFSSYRSRRGSRWRDIEKPYRSCIAHAFRGNCVSFVGTRINTASWHELDEPLCEHWLSLHLLEV